MTNPTGGPMRKADKHGAGYWGASRDGGTRWHLGADYVGTPGQAVLAPITGKVERVAHPYADDLKWSGLIIHGQNAIVRLYYMEPFLSLIGKTVVEGAPIGKMQDISQKYGVGMTPHVHLQIDSINPELLLGVRV